MKSLLISLVPCFITLLMYSLLQVFAGTVIMSCLVTCLVGSAFLIRSTYFSRSPTSTFFSLQLMPSATSGAAAALGSNNSSISASSTSGSKSVIPPPTSNTNKYTLLSDNSTSVGDSANYNRSNKVYIRIAVKIFERKVRFNG